MILTETNRPVIKSFHELLKQTAGSDEVSEQVLYDVGYSLFYQRNHIQNENKRILKGNGVLHRRTAEAEEQNTELKEAHEYFLRILGEDRIKIQTLLADKIILEDKYDKLSKRYEELKIKWLETCDELYEAQQERDELKNKLNEGASNDEKRL